MNDDHEPRHIPEAGRPAAAETRREAERVRENAEWVPVIVKRNDEARRHPDDILVMAIDEGLEQLRRRGWSLLLSSVAAGLILGFTAMAVAVVTLATGEAEWPMLSRVAVALVYPLGFVLCLMSGSELYTEHTATAVYPVLDRQASVPRLLRLWGIVVAGNLLGALASAALLRLADPVVGAADGYVEIGRHLVAFPTTPLLFSAILAGWLMALGAWLILATPPTVSQTASIYIVTFLIGLGGLHHSIAGAVEIFTAVPLLRAPVPGHGADRQPDRWQPVRGRAQLRPHPPLAERTLGGTATVTSNPDVGDRLRADRLAFLIDAAPYFEAFTESLSRAQRSVLILGWEVDSGIRLRRPPDGHDEGPTLADFLSGVLRDRPELEVHVLCWDWSMIYVFEREPWPRKRMGHDTHERLHFELDGHHPVGASHHEKVVVVDDRVAFIGGIDLGRRRWDTHRHDPDDPRLRSPSDHSYRPFHDVQAVVSGPAATALGDRARLRWRRATGQHLDPPPVSDHDPWPAEVEPVLRDVPLRLVRTDPTDELYETEAWHVAAIRSARRAIYLENQYLTSDTVGRELAACLDRPPTPEIVVVTSKESGGWLEQASMDAHRARILRSLEDRDPGGKVAAWWPDPGHGDSPTVHTKLTVVDDRLAYLGSANLSNRSMGLDTESGLTLDADDDARLEDVIRGLRRSLLAEHLGTTGEAVAEAEDTAGGVIPGVERLRGGTRTLRNLDVATDLLSAVLDPIRGLVDPERPADLGDLVPGLPWTSDDADTDG